MRSAALLACPAALLLLPSCGGPAPSPPSPAPAFRSYVDDRATVWSLSYAGEPAVAVWADAALGGGSGVGAAPDGHPNVPLVRGSVYTSREGDEATWECRAADREDGTLSFGGKTYDLAGGRAFLLHTRESPARLVQLKRDLDGIEDSPQALHAFAEADPEVSAFLTAAGGSDGAGP